MVQNTSHAVMQQRQPSADKLDFYPTPPWGTRALCRWLQIKYDLRQLVAWDPACGAHDMTTALAEYFRDVYASDIAEYPNRFSEGHRYADFLQPLRIRVDFIITNPPFTLAEEFALTALDRAHMGVALLVRTAFLEGMGRHKRLFSINPPTDILQFTERLVMHHGKLSPDGSTATSYCWAVWRKERMDADTIFHWIPPCRAVLERDSDYPAE